MCEKALFFSFVVALPCVTNAAVAPFITKCSSDDTKCLKDSGNVALPRFADGIPELGIEKLDPLHYTHLDASSNSLKLILNDLSITGIKQCEITELNRNVKKSKIFIRGWCNLVLNGQYEVDGRILVLPIRGKGAVHAKLNKIYIQVDADMAEKIKNDKKYWDIKSWKYDYELKDKAEIVLENLFDGNEVLGRAVNELLKASPNEIVNEIAPSILKSLLTKLVKTVDKFFHKVPAEELALDP